MNDRATERIQIAEVWNAKDPDEFKEKSGYSVKLADGRLAKMWLSQLEVAPNVGEWWEAKMVEPAPGKKQYKAQSPQRVGQVAHAPSQAPSQPALQPVTKYEVQDVTQRLIIRQNALNRAVELAVAMSERAPELSISETAHIWVDYFEQLIWEAASPGHEQKVLSWAGVVDSTPAGGEGTPEPQQGVTEPSPPAGAGPPAEEHITGAPQSSPAPEGGTEPPGESPKEGGGGSASPSTLAQVLRNKRQHNVSDLVFSTFLTSMGVENVNSLSEDEAQVVLAWIANGDGQVAA